MTYYNSQDPDQWPTPQRYVPPDAPPPRVGPAHAAPESSSDDRTPDPVPGAVEYWTPPPPPAAPSSLPPIPAAGTRTPWFRQIGILVPLVALVGIGVGLGIGAVVFDDNATSHTQSGTQTNVVGTSSPGAGDSTDFTVTGSLILSDSDGYGIETLGTSCTGTGGYSDISDGGQVVVEDASGTAIATGVLGSGSGGSSSCTFSFSVDDVPSGKSLYKIEVTHRGDITFTESQLRVGPVLTLGS